MAFEVNVEFSSAQIGEFPVILAVGKASIIREKGADVKEQPLLLVTVTV